MLLALTKQMVDQYVHTHSTTYKRHCICSWGLIIMEGTKVQTLGLEPCSCCNNYLEYGYAGRKTDDYTDSLFSST